jgi:ADP-dependent glucokinase
MQFASATSKSGSEDEVHVIMEYAKGASFLNTVTNRANRFIATRDIANAQFLSLKSFHQKLPEFDPHLLVLSGFHLMDGQPKEQREAEFAEITRYLKTVDKIRFVHIELASIGNREIYKEVADNVFPYVTSLGLNEQELAALYNALFPQDIKRNISQTVPDIQQVDHALQKIMQLYPTLSRIHFHSLAYHYVAINKQSGDNWGRTQKQKVESSMAAVAASSLTATQRACGYASFNDIVSNLKNVELIVEMNKLVAQLTSAGKSPNVHNHAIITWTENDLEMFVVPVLVCKQITKTVGLGDAISASGVSAQVKWLVYDIQ